MNWFREGGGEYAKFRPVYPVQVARALAAAAPNTERAVDVGCGSGQLTALLADQFDHVVGLDPSLDQLRHAAMSPNVSYVCSDAEALPIADRSVALIAAAQAAHWFDLERFYAQARRCAPGGAIGLVTYGGPMLDDAVRERFLLFYRIELGPYWPPERRLVNEEYRTIPFPFDELDVPDIRIESTMTLARFIGYVATWSAVRNARLANRTDILEAFAKDLQRLWGDDETERQVDFPVRIVWDGSKVRLSLLRSVAYVRHN